MSQLTFSQMSLTVMTGSPRQRMHWLGQQAVIWPGLPVVHLLILNKLVRETNAVKQ